MATATFSTPVREALAKYDIQDLPFSSESPRFRAGYDWHRQELQIADEHLERLTSGSQAVVRALQVLGSASGRLAADLERTPAVFQALPVTARLAGVLQDLASAGDVLAESLDLSLRTPLDALRSDVSRIDDKKRACDRADDQASATEADLLRGANQHLAAITALFVRTDRPRLPPEMVRHIFSYWLHAGYFLH